MTKTSIPNSTLSTGAGPDLTLAILLEDQKVGRSLQEHIRPRTGSVLHGIHFEHSIVPALHLSGDALDFALPDGRILAYLLDVSGHGTAAALLSMFIKSTVRYSLALQPAATAASVLADVNQALLDAGMRKYGTMVCMIFHLMAVLCSGVMLDIHPDRFLGWPKRTVAAGTGPAGGPVCGCPLHQSGAGIAAGICPVPV